MMKWPPSRRNAVWFTVFGGPENVFEKDTDSFRKRVSELLGQIKTKKETKDSWLDTLPWNR